MLLSSGITNKYC